MECWLVRHGESTWNSERRLQGALDAPLSPRGRAQASALAAVPISTSMSSTGPSEPPCSGPSSAASAPTTAGTTPALVEAITRAVKVEALRPCSAATVR